MELTLNDLPKDKRPYEKCRRYGAEKLTDEELLAVILRSGTKKMGVLALAHKIMTFSDGKLGLDGLIKLSMRDLLTIPGIGNVKSIQILAVIELSGRLARAKTPIRPEFHSPDTIGRYFTSVMRGYRQEHVVLVFLDSKNHIIGEHVLAKGTVCQAQSDPREIFVEAVRAEAVSIILVHNHPSGDPTPSMADLNLTQRVAQAGEMIGIPLKDHIIVGADRYRSLYADGVIKE